MRERYHDARDHGTDRKFDDPRIAHWDEIHQAMSSGIDLQLVFKRIEMYMVG